MGTAALSDTSPGSDLLDQFKNKLHDLKSSYDFEAMKSDQNLSESFLNELRETRPLSILLPEKYGGSGGDTQDFLSMLDITSYVSLPFSLLFGINGALFLQPLLKYGSDSMLDDVLSGFLDEKRLGGLMITEPEHGTDALKMTTNFELSNGHYNLSGLKHWAGLTGWADHWIIAARVNKEDDSLGRDIQLFVCDGDDIEVEEYYSNLGVQALPYGRNHVETEIDSARKLGSASSGLRIMQDLLHKSRLEFPGMAVGYLRNIRDEAVKHCKSRVIGGSKLSEYEHVQRKLRTLQSACTISTAMCVYTSENVDLEDDLSGELVMANTIKALVTDLMQEAADIFLQLSGADGYRSDHLAGQSYVDTRSFQIFEGPNDVLYDQIGRQILNKADKNSYERFQDYVKDSSCINNYPNELLEEVDFSFNTDFSQSWRLELGRLTSRMIAMDLVRTIAERGYPQDRYESCKWYLLDEARSIANELNDGLTDFPSLSNDLANVEWTNLTDSNND